LDIIHHVNTNLYEVIPDDPYREVLKNPKSKTLFHNMMEKRLYGNKTKAGFYKQVYTEKGKAFLQLNLQNGEYENIIEPEERLLQSYNNIKELKGRLRAICNDAWEERDKTEKSYAGFIWNTLAFTLNYSAWVMPRVSENLLSFDRAIKFGFGHELGPFEIWDALGLKEGCKRIQQIGFSIPDWVDKMIAQGYESFYKIQEDQLAFYDPVQGKYQNLKLNKRSLGFEYIKNNKKWILDSNDSASIVNLGDGVLGLEFHSKANSLNLEISAMLEKALSLLERSTWQGMVIANDGNNFSAGADLGMFLEHIENRAWDKMENLVSSLQQNLLLCRGNRKPVVAAPFNMTLGGGSEIALESSAICAYAETYMGQIEPSVGVVPALGGCKEPLRRILSPVMRRTPNENPLPLLLQVFQLIVMNKVSSSAQEARDWGLLIPTDRIVINRDHLLSSAKRMVLDLAEASYTPDSARGDIYATGITGYNYLEVYIYNMHEAGFITKHEALIARKLANILSGGPLSQPQWVDSQYILDLEREAFISLLGEEKTRERINSVLTTGKHLRN